MENTLGSSIIDVHHLVLVQEFHLRQHNMVACGLACKSWPRFKEKAHKEVESYSIVASWGDCLLWTLNFHSAASATVGHLAKSIKAAGQKRGGVLYGTDGSSPCGGPPVWSKYSATHFKLLSCRNFKPWRHRCPRSPLPILEMKHQRLPAHSSAHYCFHCCLCATAVKY